MTMEEALFRYFKKAWELFLLASGLWNEIVSGNRRNVEFYFLALTLLTNTIISTNVF